MTITALPTIPPKSKYIFRVGECMLLMAPMHFDEDIQLPTTDMVSLAKEIGEKVNEAAHAQTTHTHATPTHTHGGP